MVINKTDLVSAEHLDRLKQHLQSIQPRIFETTHGRLPLELLIGVANHPVDALLNPPQDDHVHQEHDSLFDSWQWSSPEPLSGKMLRRALRNLPSGILRAKGILYIKEASQDQMILQAVGPRLTLIPGKSWERSNPYTQVVAISMAGSVDFDELTAMFDRAIARP